MTTPSRRRACSNAARVGWPVDDRTQTGIDQLRELDWTIALTADGRPDPTTAVADLTGILRHAPAGT